MYPEEIELPEAKDFCKGQIMNGPRCCFIGWKRVLLPDLSYTQNTRFDNVANGVANDMGLKRLCHYWPASLSDINDHDDNTKKQLADWFERTIAKLGYDIS